MKSKLIYPVLSIIVAIRTKSVLEVDLNANYRPSRFGYCPLDTLILVFVNMPKTLYTLGSSNGLFLGRAKWGRLRIPGF